MLFRACIRMLETACMSMVSTARILGLESMCISDLLSLLLFILVLEALSRQFRTGVPWELILMADSLEVKSMQKSGTEAIRTQSQLSKPKRELTNITNSQNTKRTYRRMHCKDLGMERRFGTQGTERLHGLGTWARA